MSKQFTKPFNPIIWPARPKDFTSEDNLGLRNNELVQQFTFGTRHVSWDGSVYRYFKAGSTFTSYQAAIWHNITGAGVSFEAVGGDSVAGSNVVLISEASIAEDEYSGGYLLIFHTTGNGQVTAVRGNTASSGGKVVLYLDEPLAADITTTTAAIELYTNPYATLKQGNSGENHSFVGIPQALHGEE